jgi:hypothetical protein
MARVRIDGKSLELDVIAQAYLIGISDIRFKMTSTKTK